MIGLAVLVGWSCWSCKSSTFSPPFATLALVLTNPKRHEGFRHNMKATPLPTVHEKTFIVVVHSLLRVSRSKSMSRERLNVKAYTKATHEVVSLRSPSFFSIGCA